VEVPAMTHPARAGVVSLHLKNLSPALSSC